ncbi:MAG: WYL domain-containing protein [Ruminococcaceae bacterium]|nr:WYL domain-containing protein [Oscillospiraceae bacterium]
MPKSSNQKLKILYLAKIFTENTDESHPMTMAQIISALDSFGIQAERKSLYDDFENLNLFGLDICKTEGRIPGYFNASGSFEIAELKLLIDAVESARFITPKKTSQLIAKIENLTSRHNAQNLNRQVYAANRVKTLNEQIFYNVDKIHESISQNKMISFKYFDYCLSKQKKYRKDGGYYTESPVSLMWDDENYYLVAYNSKYSNYVHYRVDRMENISITDSSRQLPDVPFDSAQYARKMFSMFSGSEEFVTLRFSNSLINVVFDRFGMDITPHKDGDDHFLIKTKVAVSEQFFGWIASLGGRAAIVEPQKVKDEFLKMIESVAKVH